MTPETIITIGERAIEVTTILIAVLLVPPLIVGSLASSFFT
jgi:flagellar biosynthesis protein FliQ